MANNRIYLRCKNCGVVCFLGKCLGGAYHYDIDNDLQIKLNSFYEEHLFCDYHKEIVESNTEPEFIRRDDFHYENQFELAYESVK